MLVLIAGITGNLGQLLAANALSRGLSVRGLGREPSKLQPEIANKLESFVKSIDYFDVEALDKAVKGVDGIICCYHPTPILDLDASLLLLRAAERAGVKVFIATSWNNDWTKIKLGDFPFYDSHIAFENQAAMTSSIRPVYIFTGMFSDILLSPLGPGSFSLEEGKGRFKYWGDGNLTKWSWSSQVDVAAYTIETFLNGKGVQEGKGGFFRFRSGELTIDSLADAYKRVSGNEVEITRMGDLEVLERKLASLRSQHGRAGYWDYAAENFHVISSGTTWEMKEEELTNLEHVKKPKLLEECLKENLKLEG